MDLTLQFRLKKMMKTLLHSSALYQNHMKEIKMEDKNSMFYIKDTCCIGVSRGPEHANGPGAARS